MPLGMELGLGPGDCVRWGPAPPSPKGAQPPQFSAHICCGQMAAWIKMSLGMELGLGAGDFVLDGEPCCPLPKKITVYVAWHLVYAHDTTLWHLM